jgi:hypothetical protein
MTDFVQAMMSKLASVLVILASGVAGALGAEPNPPVWPSTVAVFGPNDDMATVQATIDAAFATNGGHDPVSLYFRRCS